MDDTREDAGWLAAAVELARHTRATRACSRTGTRRGSGRDRRRPYNPVAPALANAIRDAIGVRPHELPMSRDRLWRLARDAARGAVGSPART